MLALVQLASPSLSQLRAPRSSTASHEIIHLPLLVLPPPRLSPQSVDLCDEVAAAGTACIANKGSFSLCIPGGSVVAALAKMPTDAFDFTKMHVFFANEKIPSYPCLNGALEITKALGVPEDQARHCQQSAASPDTSTSMSAYVTATASA